MQSCRSESSDRAPAPCCAALANPRMESFAFSIIVATGKLDENDFPICRARHFNTISHHRIQMQQKSSISCSGTTKYQLITLNFLFRNLQMVQKALTLLNSKTFRRFSVVYYSPS